MKRNLKALNKKTISEDHFSFLLLWHYNHGLGTIWYLLLGHVSCISELQAAPYALGLSFDAWAPIGPLFTHVFRIEGALRWSIIFHTYDMAQLSHLLDLFALKYIHVALEHLKAL